MNDDSRFLVHNKKEVSQVMGDLARWRTEINARCGATGKGVITRVISVDQVQGVVYLDFGFDEVTGRALIDSDQVIFSTTTGLRVQWSSARLQVVRLPDGPAFRIGLPMDLVRVQRREYYRLMMPMVNPVLCRIPLSDGVAALAMADISAGGISVMLQEEHAELVPNTEFVNCRFDLSEVGETNLGLKVKWCAPMVSRNGGSRMRLGLEYIAPSRGNQALIQRYMVKLERDSVIASR